MYAVVRFMPLYLITGWISACGQLLLRYLRIVILWDFIPKEDMTIHSAEGAMRGSMQP